MRGQQELIGPLFSYVSSEDRIPKGQPLRQVRRLADQALDRLNPAFCRLYPEGERPPIPPEQLLLALLLQAIYGIRSERMLMEQLDYTCCSAGLSDSTRMIPSGIPRRSPKTVTGCSTRSSWPSFWSCFWLLLRLSRC